MKAFPLDRQVVVRGLVLALSAWVAFAAEVLRHGADAKGAEKRRILEEISEVEAPPRTGNGPRPGGSLIRPRRGRSPC